MLAVLNYLNAHNFLIFQPILMTFVSKFMFYRPLPDKTYLSFGLRSPLIHIMNVSKDECYRNSNVCFDMILLPRQMHFFKPEVLKNGLKFRLRKIIKGVSVIWTYITGHKKHIFS